MNMISRRSLLAVLLATAALTAGPAVEFAHADKSKKRRRKKKEQDDAWAARQDGSILPLSEVLALVGPKIRGEIIETELDYEDGQLVYEFKYVNVKGRVREVYVDARTGAILKDKPD